VSYNEYNVEQLGGLRMKVLVACEYSGTVRDAFTAAGHDAMSCDLLPTESEGPHYQGDVRDVIDTAWDLVIAHPTCRYLTNSGVRWLHDQRPKFANRWQDLDEGAAFFKMFLDLEHVPRVAVENPKMHKYAIERIGGVKPTQYVQPYQFGHTETKQTGLWLKNLPPLVPTHNVEQEMRALAKKDTHKVHYASPGPDREKQRSMFFPGIATAMAQQWSNLT